MIGVHCFDGQSRRWLKALGMLTGLNPALAVSRPLARAGLVAAESSRLNEAVRWSLEAHKPLWVWQAEGIQQPEHVHSEWLLNCKIINYNKALSKKADSFFEGLKKALQQAPERFVLSGGEILGTNDGAWLWQARARHIEEAGAPVVCLGVKAWNHRSMSHLLGNGQNVTFVSSADQALDTARRLGGPLVVWGMQQSDEVLTRFRAAGISVRRIEDGFIRSVGLGAGLVACSSIAMDDEGLYYAPTTNSRLFRLLSSFKFSQDQRERGHTLKRLLSESRVTKYNLTGKTLWQPADRSREIILVPGQVADDMAVRRGVSDRLACQSDENINIQLLQAVRQDYPQAHIVYKPHPDVVSGLRKGHIDAPQAQGLCDEEIGRADLIHLITQCDRVATLSSLTGFEALIRDKPVTTYGLPFYAGWGLTEDRTRSSARTRTLKLEELIYLVLVEYTRMIDPLTLSITTPERLIRRLAQLRERRQNQSWRWVLQQVSWAGRRLGI